MYSSRTLCLAFTLYVFLFISDVYGHLRFHPSCPYKKCPYVRKDCRLETTFIHEGVPCEDCPMDICEGGMPDIKVPSDRNIRNNRERPIVALLERLRRPRRRDRPTEQPFLQERHNQRKSLIESILHDLPPRRSHERLIKVRQRDPHHDSGVRSDPHHDLGSTSDPIDHSFFSDIPLRHKSKSRPRTRSNDIDTTRNSEPSPWDRNFQREHRVDSPRSEIPFFRPDPSSDHMIKTFAAEPRVINHDSVILRQTEISRTDTGNQMKDNSRTKASDVFEIPTQIIESVNVGGNRNDIRGQKLDALQIQSEDTRNADSTGVHMNELLRRNLDAPVSGTSRNDIFVDNIEAVNVHAGMNDLLKRNLDIPLGGTRRKDAIEINREIVQRNINNIQRQNQDTVGSSDNRNEMLMKNLDTVDIGTNTNGMLRNSLEEKANSDTRNDMLMKNLDTAGPFADKDSMLVRNLDVSGGNTNRNDMHIRNLDSEKLPGENPVAVGSSTNTNPSTSGLVPLLPINPFDLGNFANTVRNEGNAAEIRSQNSITDSSQQSSSQIGQNGISALFDDVPKTNQPIQDIRTHDSIPQIPPPANTQTVRDINPQVPVQSIQGTQPSINQQQLSAPSSNPRIMPIPIMNPGLSGIIPNILGVPFSPIQMQVISTLMAQMRLASGFSQGQFPQTSGVGFPSSNLHQTGGTGFPVNQQLQMRQNQILPFPNGGSAMNLAGSIPPVSNGGIPNLGSPSANLGIEGVPNTGLSNNQIQTGGLVGINSVPPFQNAANININARGLNPSFPNGGQSPLNMNLLGSNRGASMGSHLPFSNIGTNNNNFANPSPQLPFSSNQQSLGTNFNIPQIPIPNAIGTGINPTANPISVNSLTQTSQTNQAPIPQTMAPGSTFPQGPSIDDELHRLLTSVTSLDADGQFLDSNGQSVLDTSLLSGLPDASQGSSGTAQSRGSVNTQTPLFDMLALVNSPQNSASPNLNSVG